MIDYEIIPCPFCGASDPRKFFIVSGPNSGPRASGYAVKCPCGAMGSSVQYISDGTTNSRAVKAWNSRIAPPEGHGIASAAAILAQVRNDLQDLEDAVRAFVAVPVETVPIPPAGGEIVKPPDGSLVIPDDISRQIVADPLREVKIQAFASVDPLHAVVRRAASDLRTWTARGYK